MLQWEPHLERLQKKRRHGKDSPAARKALNEQPDVDGHLQWIWDAFWTLSGGRTYGGGMSPVPNGISFESIDAYAKRARLTGWEEFSRFERTVRAMDSAYIADAVRKAKSKGPKK